MPEAVPVISATLPSTLPIDGGLQGLRLARLSRLVRCLDHLDDVAGVLAGRDGPTDRKSLLPLRALARSLKPKACVSMGAE